MNDDSTSKGNKHGDQGDIVIYQTEDGVTKVDVRFVDDTVI